MAENVENPTFAEYYNGYRNRIIVDIVPLVVLRIILQIIGMVGNGFIVSVTIQHKKFQHACGILLATGAISDSVHQLSHYYFGYLTLSGKNFTTLQTCVLVNILPIIGMSTGILMTLFIGIDRALSVFFLTWHRKQSCCFFLSIYFGLCILYNAYWTVNIYIEMAKDPNRETICLITDAQPGWTQLYWFNACLVINFLTIVCYLIVWIIIKVNKTANQSLFKSLLAITLVIFLGWMLYAMVNLVVSSFNLTLLQAWYIGFYVGIMVNLAISINYLILYAFSKEYRKAFQQQLVYIFPGTKNHFFKSAVTTVKATSKPTLVLHKDNSKLPNLS